MWYKNIASRFFGLVTKHACDGQNYDSQDLVSDIAIFVLKRDVKLQLTNSQDRASIAASRGKNHFFYSA